MKSIALQQNGDKYLVAVLNDDDTLEEYVACSYFNPSAPYGSQWCWGHYFGKNLSGAVDYFNGKDPNRKYHTMAALMYYDQTKYGAEACTFDEEFFKDLGEDIDDYDWEKLRDEIFKHPAVLEVWGNGYGADGKVWDITLGYPYVGMGE